MVGNTEPSQIKKLGMSQLRQSALTTLSRREAHARGTGQMVGIVVLPKDVLAPTRSRLCSSVERVVDQAPCRYRPRNR